MTLLFRLLYATHANGTHHKLAFDALRGLDCAHAEAWRRVFLKHADLFMEGAKAPDKEFKDFRNHVLHVGDNFWGGAPEKVTNWYAHTVSALKAGDWETAVYSAGVLSHYYTDPIHPFHTAQSDAENSMHRAVEWSISKTYDRLRARGLKAHSDLVVPVPEGPSWLTDMTIAGAETSNADYEHLIAHYNLAAGVASPEDGLDAQAEASVAKLLIYAANGTGRILSRAIADADVAPPIVSLTVDTVLATLKIPLRWVQKKLSDAEDRAVVQAMWDELQRTGRVEATLPADDRAVRDAHAREVLGPRLAARTQRRAQRVGAAVVPDVEAPAEALSKLSTPHQSKSATPVAHPPALSVTLPSVVPAPARMTTVIPAAAAAAAPLTIDPDRVSVPSIPRAQAPGRATTTPTADRSQTVPEDLRVGLAADDPIVDAPSIGPKTAARLEAHGIHTVQDLFDCDVDAVAADLGVRHITAATLTAWQDQAELVMLVPGLRGSHAQLLVGAGYTDADTLADAEPPELAAAILRYVATPEGQRVLRDGTPPTDTVVTKWIANALKARTA